MTDLHVAPEGATSLPGGWVVLRDPDAVPERLRRPIMRAQSGMLAFQNVVDAAVATGTAVAAGAQPEPAPDAEAVKVEAFANGPELMDAMMAIDDVTIVAFVSAWSFDGEISVTSVGDLPSGTYKSLVETVRPLRDVLFTDFDDAGDGIDKTTPTGPSVA